MFGLDLTSSTVTMLYIKVPIYDLILYFSAMIGFYKNYKANMVLIDKQIEALDLKKEEKADRKDAARKSFIKDKAKTLFLEIEKLAKKTKMKGDDKLISYIKAFTEGMEAKFADVPNEEEISLMKDKAFELDIDLKLAKGKDIDKSEVTEDGE